MPLTPLRRSAQAALDLALPLRLHSHRCRASCPQLSSMKPPPGPCACRSPARHLSAAEFLTAARGFAARALPACLDLVETWLEAAEGCGAKPAGGFARSYVDDGHVPANHPSIGSARPPLPTFVFQFTTAARAPREMGALSGRPALVLVLALLACTATARTMEGGQLNLKAMLVSRSGGCVWDMPTRCRAPSPRLARTAENAAVPEGL